LISDSHRTNVHFVMNHIYSILVSLFDTILKETHPRTIPARFGLIWFGGFRGDDFKVQVYNRRTTDAK